MKPIQLLALSAATAVCVAAIVDTLACGHESPTQASSTPASSASVPQVPFPPPRPQGEPTDANDLFKGEPRLHFAPKDAELPFVEFSEGLPHSGTWRGYPLLHDFNHDGRADLVASNREEDGFNFWLAPAKGPWVLCIEGPQKDVGGLPRDMMYGPSQAADVDGDGNDDLLVSAHTNGLRLFRSVPAQDAKGALLADGKLHWLECTAPIQNPYLMLDIAVGNLDGDGRPDVVGIGHFKGGIAAYLGDGKCGMRRLPESAQIVEKGVFGQFIELVDLDGDGTDDIVSATNKGLKALITHRGNEGFGWEDRSVGLPAPKIGNSITGLAVGRFRGQGMPEIAMCLVPDPTLPPESIDSLGVYGWNPEKKTWEHVDSGLRRGDIARELGAADLNGDGHLDLVCFSLESGAVVYLGDGHGGFAAKGRLPGMFGIGRIAFGDIDGDKLTDIVVSIPATKERPQAGGLRALLNRREIWN